MINKDVGKCSNFLYLPTENSKKNVENYLKNKQDGKTLKINNHHVVKSENIAETKSVLKNEHVCFLKR